jgi:hypothetical protein
MKNHVDIYRQFWWDQLTLAQTEQCDLSHCSTWGGEVHHIKKRGGGGSKYKCFDTIENLIFLCRTHHELADKNKEFNKFVRVVNLLNIADKLKDELDPKYLELL